jgi:hypothetical protein
MLCSAVLVQLWLLGLLSEHAAGTAAAAPAAAGFVLD